MTMDLRQLGTFDLVLYLGVLYLGVLYHMRDPLLALERLRQVTKTLAILETALEARDDTFPVEVGGIAVK